MFEFYRENVKYYLKIAFYRYMVYLLFAISLFLPLVVVVYLLRKINIQLFNIAVVSIAVAPIIMGVLLFLVFLLKFLFITGYSFVKEQEGSIKRLQARFRIIKKIISPKVSFLALVIIISGYVIYSQILPDIVPSAEIDNVILSLALTLLIYGILFFLFRTLHTFVSLIRALWEYFPGLVWRLLVALALITSQLVLLAAIYLVVSVILVPMILK